METMLRNEPRIDATAFISNKDKLPHFGEWVTVIADGDRCLGFLGPHGVWRDLHSGCPLDNVEFWQPLEEDQRRRRSS